MTQPIDPVPTPVPDQKIPHGWLAVMTSPQVIGGIFLVFSGWMAVRSQAADLPAEQKMELYRTFYFSAAGLWAAIIGALGYQTGKLYEGTVPKGFKSIVPPAQATAIGEVKTSTASFAQPTERQGFVSTQLLLVLACVAMLVASIGCAGTSKVFQATVKPSVELIAEEMHDYTAKNPALDDAGKSVEQARTDLLTQSVAITDQITAQDVKAKWEVVEPVYRNYVETDPTLTNDEAKHDVLTTADKLDTLIAAEVERQHNIFGIFAPSPAVPTSQPSAVNP